MARKSGARANCGFPLVVSESADLLSLIISSLTFPKPLVKWPVLEMACLANFYTLMLVKNAKRISAV